MNRKTWLSIALSAALLSLPLAAAARPGHLDVRNAAYVLAKARRMDKARLRYLHDDKLKEISSPLARAQLAASLALYGDAVRSDALSHLSVLAIQSGGELIWDPKAYRIVSPEPLNDRMSHPIRGDWKQS